MFVFTIAIAPFTFDYTKSENLSKRQNYANIPLLI